MVSNRLFQVYFAYTLSIIFATVYLRYHYTVDLLAGAIVALFLILASPSLYRNLQGRA
jgi:membrane-associated phospholipid phosphatase